MTVFEIAVLFGHGSTRRHVPASELLADLENNPAFAIVPISIAIANEVASMGRGLHDPSDRTIVATARVERLRLLTSDQRIIESNLVPVVS